MSSIGSIKRWATIVARAALLGICILALAGKATLVLAAPSPVQGTHFIVLLDDSGDMRGRRNAMVEVATRALFEEDEGTGKPAFDSDRGDRISALYFGFGRGCLNKTRDRSASPDGLFEWIPSQRLPRSADGFSRFLAADLEQSCRFRSDGTPANTAPLASLKSIQGHLKLEGASQVFEQTFVILVSNNLTNGPPSTELDYYRSKGIEDTGATKELVGEIGRFFGSPVEPTWARNERSRPKDPVTAQFFRIQPLQTQLAEQALEFKAPILVDRKAIASDLIQVVGRGDSAALSIDTKNITPFIARLKFFGVNGTEPWQIGSQTVPVSHEINFSDCPKAVCTSDNGTLKVDLLAVLSEAGVYLKANDALPLAGKATFTVGFRYPNEFYDAAAIFTPARTVALRPVAPTKVRSGWLLQPIEYELDNPGLLQWFDSADGPVGLGQADAEIRARNRLNAYQIIELGLMLAALLILLWILGHRGFDPEVIVSTIPSSIPIDGANSAPFLIGRVTIINRAPQPRLHRWFGRSFEFRHLGSLTLSFKNWDDMSRRLKLRSGMLPLGFLPRGQTNTSDKLTSFAIYDGAEIPFYLDQRQIEDLNEKGCSAEGTVLQVEILARLTWSQLRFCDAKPQKLRVSVEPELPREPTIEWEPRSAVEFRGDDTALELGHFVLRSQARKLFALPFVGNYEMLLSNERNEPLPATALTLGGEQLADGEAESVFRLEVPARDELRVPVTLDCTRGLITNPAASDDRYNLSIVQVVNGKAGISSPTFTLVRDSRAADLKLNLRQAIAGHDDEVEYEIYWEGGHACRRRLSSSEPDVRADGWSLALPEGSLQVTPGALAQVPVVLQIAATNTARSGQGRVQLRVEVTSKFDGLSHAAPQDVVVFRTIEGQVRNKFTIEPGKTARGEIILNSQHLPPLITAYGTCTVTIEIHADVDPGNGQAQRKKQVKLEFCLRLSETPNDLWLCIDFGTSAVAVAHGRGTDLEFADLQAVPCHDRRSFAILDGRNSEQGTPFLPSTVFFPGPDDRNGAPGRAGTPWGATDDRPGQSSFVSLPARVHDIRDHPMRVATSLKSWLSDGRKYLVMPEPIQCLGNRTRTLDLDAVLSSVYRALTEGYIKADVARHGADRLVLTHPNCFTDQRRKRLNRVAFEALGIGSGPRYLELKNPERVALLSESDAVAYFHCWLRYETRTPWNGQKPERVVVYDLGAGTLDLSLVEVTWAPSGIVQEFRVKARLGVALAGDAIDERLCRIIDAAIRREIAELPPTVSYRLPLVKKKGMDSGPAAVRPSAIQEFRTRLRSSKYQWAKDVAEKGSAEDTYLDIELGAAQEMSLIWPEGEGGKAMEEREAAVVAGLYTRKAGGEHRLRLPGPEILRDPKMAELVSFLTVTVIKELMSLAGQPAESVNTLLISGRGALWPGVRQSVKSQFPKAETPQWKANDMKMAVARGAVAGRLLWFVKRHVDDSPPPRWGLLHDNGRQLVLEDRWTTRIPIVGDKVQLFQVGISSPDPKRDKPLGDRPGVSGSLRSAFYTRLVRDDISLPEGTEYVLLEKTGEDLETIVRIFAKGSWVAIDAGLDPPGPPTWLASYLLEEEP